MHTSSSYLASAQTLRHSRGHTVRPLRILVSAEGLQQSTSCKWEILVKITTYFCEFLLRVEQMKKRKDANRVRRVPENGVRHDKMHTSSSFLTSAKTLRHTVRPLRISVSTEGLGRSTRCKCELYCQKLGCVFMSFVYAMRLDENVWSMLSTWRRLW